MSTNGSLVVPIGKLVLWACFCHVKISKESRPIHSKIDGRKITSPGHGSSQLFPFQMTQMDQMAYIHGGVPDDPHGRGSPFLSTYKKGSLGIFTGWLQVADPKFPRHGRLAHPSEASSLEMYQPSHLASEDQSL